MEGVSGFRSHQATPLPVGVLVQSLKWHNLLFLNIFSKVALMLQLFLLITASSFFILFANFNYQFKNFSLLGKREEQSKDNGN